MITVTTKYLTNEEAAIKISQYSTGNTALQLISPEGELLMTATVNLPQVILQPDEVLVKDYSENEGILSELLRLNIIQSPAWYVTSGFVDIPVCVLNNSAGWKL